MTFSEFAGVKNANIDIETGEKLEHRDIYRRAIQRFGGLCAVKPYIPFTLEKIKKALSTDEYLNNLSMREWDIASGFQCRGGDCRLIGTGVVALYRKHHINAFSNAQGVCLLKEAAREWAEEERDV